MRVIAPIFLIEQLMPYNEALLLLEKAARTAYKSEHKIAEGSAEPFLRMLIRDKKHLSVIEHVVMSVRFITNRGVTHELVRHRLASYTQESTRFCNYSKQDEVVFIKPSWLDVPIGEYLLKANNQEVYFADNNKNCLRRVDVAFGKEAHYWTHAMATSEYNYLQMIVLGLKPQQARGVLPNDLKTEIVMTANLREWREVFKQRTSKAAHPDMQAIMVPLLRHLKVVYPVFFEDL